MLRTAARTALKSPMAIAAGLKFTRQLKRHSLAIVMYHGVVARESQVFNWCQLQRDVFASQIAYLASRYQILPLPQIIDRLSNGLTVPDGAVCLTFDDGFRSVLLTACPILKQYRAPATVFLVTNLVGGTSPPWPDFLFCAISSTREARVQFDGNEYCLQTTPERARAFASICGRLLVLPSEHKEIALTELIDKLGRPSLQNDDRFDMLDWKDVEELAATELISFGSHTHTHQVLSRCNQERQFFELSTSRKILQQHLGNIDLFAYPNGTAADYTAETKRLVANAGYRCGLTTVPGLNQIGSDLYELRRVNVGANTSSSEFRIAMLGW